MRLLLDTNVAIMLTEAASRLSEPYRALLAATDTSASISVIALWEIGIKYRLGKLKLIVPPEAWLARLPSFGIATIDLGAQQAITDSELPKSLRDPFDRMFVAIAEVEQMKFLTTDAKLLDHPLAWRP